MCGEASVTGIDRKKKDFSFTVNGEKYCVRSLIQEFNTLVAGIKREDVLMHYNDRPVCK